MPSPRPSPTGEGEDRCRFVGCRLSETVETAALCSLSCGRGLGRGLTAVAEKLVCAATVLPSPRPSPTGEGEDRCRFVGCRLPETIEAAALCSLSCGRGFAAVAEKLVCAATVLPSPQPSPTGEGAVCCGFVGCRSSETASAV